MNNISQKGGYTKKTGPLNKEEDELEEGPWHRVQPQPSDENLLKEAEREGSWGRLLAACSDRSLVDRFGEERTYSTFSHVKHKPKQGRKTLLGLLTHTHAHINTHTAPSDFQHDTIRLVHKHADL